MSSLFEKQDSLNSPIETFFFDTEKMSFPVKPHWHYFAEFIYVINGKAAVTCDGIQYDVSEGEFIILYPSAVHSIMSTDGKPILFAGLKFDPAKFQNSSSYAPSVTAVFRYARSKDMQIHFSSSVCADLRDAESRQKMDSIRSRYQRLPCKLSRCFRDRKYRRVYRQLP